MDDDVLLRFLGHGLIDVGGDDTKLAKLQAAAKELAATLAASPRRVVPGTLHPDEVLDQTGLEVPEGEYETIAGFVLDQLGRIPDVGDSVEHDGWSIEVAAMDRRRVSEVRLRPLTLGEARTETEPVDPRPRRSER